MHTPPHQHTGARTVLRVQPPPRKKKNKVLRGAVIMVGAMLLTTLAINASDTFSTPGTSLLAGVGNSGEVSRCPSDMVYISQSSGGYCIDRYENSPGEKCAHVDPQNQLDTEENLMSTDCVSVSTGGVRPWTNVSLMEAMQLCARVGKHLPDNSEWFRASFGTPDVTPEGTDPACVTGRIGESRAALTGVASKCISSSGASDMVGNVWEWVDAHVSSGMYDGRMLPGDGYVVEADVHGTPVRTDSETSVEFHGDYFNVNLEGTRGMFRGGFWSMGEKAGIYSMNASIPTSFVGSAVGFRCAK